jgi:hypothetical protein
MRLDLTPKRMDFFSGNGFRNQTFREEHCTVTKLNVKRFGVEMIDCIGGCVQIHNLPF